MALTHITALRNSLADLVVDAIDVGTTDATGDLQFAVDSTFAVILATLAFANPAFAAAAGGVAVADPIASDTNAAGGGSTTAFRIRNRDNAEVLRGTVTATGGGGDVQLSSTLVTNGDTVAITSMSYTASP